MAAWGPADPGLARDRADTLASFPCPVSTLRRQDSSFLGWRLLGRGLLGAGRWAGCVSVSATWRVCLGDSSSRGLRALPHASSVVNRVTSPAEGHLKGPVGGPGPLPLIACDSWPTPALSPKVLGVGEPRRSGPSGRLPARWGLGRMSKCPACSRRCCGRLAHACPSLVSGL